MFGNRKSSGLSDDDVIDANRSPKATKAKKSQEYASVLNSSSHGLFSIEDEEDEDEDGLQENDNDEPVEIILNGNSKPGGKNGSYSSLSNSSESNSSKKNKKRGNSGGNRGRNAIQADRQENGSNNNSSTGKTNVLNTIFKIWNTMTFSWMRPLLVIGNQRALLQEDLYDLAYEDSSVGVYSQFSKYWKKQLLKSGKYNKALTESDFKKQKEPSLSMALLLAFGGPFMGAGFLKLIHDTLLFVGPLALNKLIFILNDPEEELATGLYYVLAIFLANFIMSLCLRQYFWWCYRVGMRLRSAVTTSVYTKALSLSTAAMSERTTGEISNLMSVDASRLQELAPYLHAVWYSFYQIAIALYFLWQQMGISSLAGIAVILLLIPLTGKVSKVLKSLQKEMSRVRDERIKVSNEVLGGMKVIKFQAWEGEFEKRINEIRDRELALFRKYCIMQSVSGAVFTAVPLLVSIVTFTAYIGTGNSLDVATALTSLALFEILRFPLFMLPNVLNNLVEAKVSIDRVSGFLLAGERKKVKKNGLQSNGVFMKKSTLIWDGQDSKNKNNRKNLKKTKILPKLSPASRVKSVSKFFGTFGRRSKMIYSRLFGNNTGGGSTEETDDIEMNNNSRNNSNNNNDEDDDNEDNEEDNEFSLILGETLESHLMSVFRAQVNVSETRISMLENELKKTKERNGRNENNNLEIKINTGFKNKLYINSAGKSSNPSLSSLGTSMMNSVINSGDDADINNGVIIDHADYGNGNTDHSSSNPIIDETNINGNNDIVHTLDKRSNININASVTDESDDKWHSTHNPLLTESKEDAMVTEGGGEGGGQSDRLLTLSRISLQAKEGDLIAIVGQVGSGKSSILGGLLGDMKLCLGDVGVRGSVAYMGQRPFIQNSTLRDNITFGLPFDQMKYDQTLFECALLPDLKVLPGGDMTEIGERGINLSGGQKARVALARTVYADANVYLLDDPLAAVDAHVGQHLFEQCILNLKKRNKCILLVTNALQFLRNCSQIIVLRDGQIVESGSYDELLATGYWLNEMITTHLDSSNSTSSSRDNSIKNIVMNGEISETDAQTGKIEKLNEKLDGKVKIISEKNVLDAVVQKPEGVEKLTSSGKLLTIEEKEQGDVSMKVYGKWLSAAGGKSVGIMLLFLYYAGEAVAVLASWWLSVWSEDRDAKSPWFYLAIYVMINLFIAVFALSRELYARLKAWSAGRMLFREMLSAVLYAPMSFFDTTPLGRIVNRFSKDINTVDESIPQTVRSYLQCMAKVTGVLLYASVVTPFFMVGLVPICAFYVIAQRYYIKTSRELTRLESTSRSPIYALFGETLDGLSTIRAYRSEKRFRAKNDLILDNNQKAFFLNFSANCWLAVRLEMAGTLIATFAALFAVLGRDTTNGATDVTVVRNRAAFAGLAGLSISFALSVTQSLNWSVRMASDLESQMVSVERVKSYSGMEQEAPHHTSNDPRPSAQFSNNPSVHTWPSEGEIQMNRVCLRYRESLPLVLDNVTLTIRSKEKIGIVGRTGAGKSSLVTAILRMVEMESGSIVIDGVDISSIGLNALRSKIAVIPQDPVLFSGSIRSNLDPFLIYTDNQIWENLRRVMLASSITSLEDLVLENGANFSVGQRQLLCIARALLSKATIIIMDEATAAVDVETDASIQKSIREEFANATCLTVAHRLNTIMDSDKVLVMDMGTVAEFDSPANLLARKDSMFSALVNDWDSSTSD